MRSLPALILGWLLWSLAALGAPGAPHIVAYVREGCPHCADAEVWLSEHPEIQVELRDVGQDRAALAELRALAEARGLAGASVPTFLVGAEVRVGFGPGTGEELLALLSADQTRRGVRVPLLGEVSAEQLGLPAFSLVLGLADGFNPCAMWVLLFLLSVLVRLRDRGRMALVGGTFVVVSGAVYYAFMAAWLNAFLLVGMSRALQLVLGALALGIGAVNAREALAAADRYTLSISSASKRRIAQRMHAVLRERRTLAALLGVAGLAVLVNLVELLCTAGLPAVYTQVLAAQGLSTGAYYGYLGLYIVAYMLDDTLMLIVAVATLSQEKLQEHGGRQLKLLSGLVMLALGAVLILRPSWLAW